MSNYKIFLGYLAVAIELASYAPYFWGIYKGKIKPHAFTWFVWGTLTGIGFVAQILSGAGAGSWIMALNSIFCFAIAGIGFRQKHVKFVLFDWVALVGAFLAIVFWRITDNPLTAVVLISVSDGIGLLPTIRKVYYFPDEESISPWALGILYYIISLFALQSFTITTWLYPAAIILFDSIFVLEATIRRRQFANKRLQL
ncbi:MAG: hypothetical protein WDN47_02315 [Candidatus Doudnabacteria bacterium]